MNSKLYEVLTFYSKRYETRENEVKKEIFVKEKIFQQSRVLIMKYYEEEPKNEKSF